MQQCSNGMCNKNQQLSDALKKLKGRIPAPDMPPGAAGDEEEDERAAAQRLSRASRKALPRKARK